VKKNTKHFYASKVLLLVLFLFVFINITYFLGGTSYIKNADAQAQAPSFYCFSNKPCTSISPSSTQNGSPSKQASPISPATSSNPQPSSGQSNTSPSQNPSPYIIPCSTSGQSVTAQSTGTVQAMSHDRGRHRGKWHYSGRQGYLQQFMQLILQLLQQLFKQLGINFPVTGPCPSSSPSTGPSTVPSTNVGAPSVSVNPSSAPSTTISKSASSPSPSGTTKTSGCATPTLPSGVTGTFVNCETGAQLYADSGWGKSVPGASPNGLNPSSGCWGLSGTIAVDGTYLDLTTKASSSWNCAGIESTATFTPGHIFQLYENIPAAANGNIADYPSWWLNDTSWTSEVDMAEAHAWGTTSPIDGQMCLDIHLNQNAQSTSPNCVTEKGGWHTYTLVWQANGNITMYYDGSKVSPQGVTGTSATDDHMIIWNDNNGGSGTVDSTLKVGYLAEWSL
jgi:hypothetical protein